jgi:hypothetical protein
VRVPKLVIVLVTVLMVMIVTVLMVVAAVLLVFHPVHIVTGRTGAAPPATILRIV